MLYERHFTVEEANSLVPKLAAHLKEILELNALLEEKGMGIYVHRFFGGSGNGNRPHLPEFDRLMELVENITREGCLIKDINVGLIDFPHLREGEEVYLCWRMDEPEVRFWHPINTGFYDRRGL